MSRDAVTPHPGTPDAVPAETVPADAAAELRRAPEPRLAARSTSWWGMALGIGALASMLSTIIFAGLYLRGVSEMWPPEGMAPGLLLPAVVTGIAAVSVVPVGWAHRAGRYRDPVRLQVGSAIGALLGIGVLVVGAVDLATAGFRWDSHAYGSVYWLGVGFHWLTTLAGVLMLLYCQLQVWRPRLQPRGRAAAANIALFWYYVAAGWPCIYLAVIGVSR